MKTKLDEYDKRNHENYDSVYNFPLKFVNMSQRELIVIHKKMIEYWQNHQVVGCLLSYHRGNFLF
jgi:hypothetical protein